MAFLDREALYKQVWDEFNVQRKLCTADRKCWKMVACVGTPGSGKTRFLAEVLKAPHPLVASHFRNYAHIHATYNNGNETTQWDLTLPPNQSFATRLLYHYFVEHRGVNPKCISSFFNEVGEKTEYHWVDFYTALTLIRDDVIAQQKLDCRETVHVAIGVDEFNKLLPSTNPHASPLLLKQLVASLGSTMISPPPDTKFYVLFGGTASHSVQDAGLGSSFDVTLLRLPPLKIDSSIFIAEQILSWEHVRTNPCLRSLLVDIGGHPRLLQYLLQLLKEYQSPEEVDWCKIQIEYSRVVRERLSGVAADVLVIALRDFITQKIVEPYNFIKPGVTYEDLEQKEIGLSLVRDKDGCKIYWPFICLQSWCLGSRDTSLALYQAVQGVCRSTLTAELYTWQNFERFCAQFMALRIASYAEQGNISLAGFLRGAVFSQLTKFDIELVLKDIQTGLVRESDDTFPSKKSLRRNGGLIDWQQTGQVVVNNEGAPFDFFFNVPATGLTKGFFICGQVKYYTTATLTAQMVQREYKKVKKAMKKAKFGDWCLLIVTIGDFDGLADDIPERCALVSRKNFEEFFTKTFADRAQFSCKFTAG